ncbi:hypothetical protein NDU88_008003 [Pleurodeles waltl]|uniref:Uncharacterized protein n=1 Tax=Pleurodeles waltl TaxID=8319 RepID=A0AAV7N3Q6_PLEWA|nr:hypothetical protein NDU88_008003 [Pleurodeles waltl]
MRLTGRGTDMGLDAHVVEPTRAELLPTIQGSREALEGMIESVAIKVNLLSADLRKVSDRVQITEGSISENRTEVDVLQKQVAEIASRAATLEDRVEDAEGRSYCNNIRLIGFQKRAKRSAEEAFVEHWIQEVLKPIALSPIFAN